MFLDILNPVFILAGVERAVVLDWSHSVAMSLVWSVLFGALFVWRGRTVALAIAVAVFSHFVLDALVHSELALWPHSSVRLGLGLWRTLPTGWWFVELAFVGAGVLYYWKRSRDVGSFGKRAWALTAIVVIVHILNVPWLSRT